MPHCYCLLYLGRHGVLAAADQLDAHRQERQQQREEEEGAHHDVRYGLGQPVFWGLGLFESQRPIRPRGSTWMSD